MGQAASVPAHAWSGITSLAGVPSRAGAAGVAGSAAGVLRDHREPGAQPDQLADTLLNMLQEGVTMK